MVTLLMTARADVNVPGTVYTVLLAAAKAGKDSRGGQQGPGRKVGGAWIYGERGIDARKVGRVSLRQ